MRLWGSVPAGGWAVRRLRFVWWGWRWSFGFKRLDLAETDLALIYRWMLFLGPVEIRRWQLGMGGVTHLRRMGVSPPPSPASDPTAGGGR